MRPNQATITYKDGRVEVIDDVICIKFNKDHIFIKSINSQCLIFQYSSITYSTDIKVIKEMDFVPKMLIGAYISVTLFSVYQNSFESYFDVLLLTTAVIGIIGFFKSYKELISDKKKAVGLTLSKSVLGSPQSGKRIKDYKYYVIFDDTNVSSWTFASIIEKELGYTVKSGRLLIDREHKEYLALLKHQRKEILSLAKNLNVDLSEISFDEFCKLGI